MALCVQRITVEDQVAPTINCPAGLTVECGIDTSPTTAGTPTASDNCGGTPAVSFTDTTFSPPSGPVEVITRTWRATDENGSTSTCDQVITVVDTTGRTAPAASGKAGGFLAMDWNDGSPTQELTRRSFALHQQQADDLGADTIQYRRLQCAAIVVDPACARKM